MFEQSNIFQNGFERYAYSLGVQTYGYGNATHAFADILHFLNNKNSGPSLNIIMPSFIPAKLYKTILAYGYTPRFYEIDNNCRFDVNEINELIDNETKAVFIIHYFGYPANINQLRDLAKRKNIILIEDCAHVIYGREAGGRLGTWGDFSIFSPRKMLNLPEGGYLILNKRFNNFNPSYTKRVNTLYTMSKLVQSRSKYFYLTLTRGNDILGLSKIPSRGFIDYRRIQKSPIRNISRLSEFYSRVVDIRAQIEKRQQNYIYLFNGIKDFTFLKPLFDDLPNTWTPYSLPVIVENGYRDLLQTELVKSGISCGAGWPESPFDKRFKKTLELAKNLIELPVHPLIRANQLKKILDQCGKFEKKILEGKKSGKTSPAPVFNELENFSSTQQIKGYDGRELNNSLIAESKNELSTDIIKTKVVRTDFEFDNLRSEWEELCERSESHIFQTFDWQRLWWKYYGENKQLNLILFYLQNDIQGEKLIGIAPFFIDVKYIRGIRIISRLRLMGSGVENNTRENISEYGVSDYLDLILYSGYEKIVVEALSDHLRKNFQHYDIIQLDEVCTDSTIFKFLLPLLDDFKWQHKIIRSEICPRVTIPDSINKYFKQLKPKVRYQLKKVRHDISDSFLFKVEKVKTQYELEKSFNEFVQLHQKRWNHKGLSGLFSDNKYRHFLEEVVYSFLKKEYLNFTTVYSNDECVAAECAFKYKRLYYDYLKAFDDQSPFARLRPGKALLLLLIEDAFENKMEVVDMLRGNENYKFEFATEWHWIYRVTIGNPKSGISLRYSIFKFNLVFQLLKRRIINELKIILTHIKNHGLSGLTAYYVPATIEKMKKKLHSFIPQKEREALLNEKESGIKNNKSIMSDLANSINEIGQ